MTVKQNFKRTYIALLAYCVSCGGSVIILAVCAAMKLCCVSWTVSVSLCLCVCE